MRESSSSHGSCSPYDRISIPAAIRILQQVGLDMLWRLGEEVMAVRWMLGHGKVIDHISLHTMNQSMLSFLIDEMK